MGNYYVPPKDRFHNPKRKVMYYPILPRIPGFFKKNPGTKQTYTSNACTFNWYMYSMRYTTSGNFIYQNLANSARGVGFSAVRTFQYNKDWRQIVDKRGNATYPYSRTGGDAKPILYNGTSASGTEHSNSYGSVLGSVLIDTSGDAILKDIALSRLKNRLSGDIGKASLLPPLAESREIHGLIHDINSFGLDALKALLALKRTHGKSVIKLAGKIWLFFSFGVNPLLSDLSKAAQSILDYNERTDHSVSVHGTASKIWFSQGLTNLSNIAQNVLMDVISSAKHQLSYRYKGSVALTTRSNASYSVLDHLGIQVGQLPSALWELTPFSWVVDYFTTVGPWLDDVFYTLPGNLKYLSLNQRYENECTHFPKMTCTIGSNAIVASSGRTRYFSFARTSLASLPTRALRIRSFDEIEKYSLGKLLNLASVLAGHLHIGV